MRGSRDPIDFVSLAAALLDRVHILVPRWLPAGVERNGRWYVGDFDGAAGESANVNLATGQWYDNAGGDEDKGGDLVSLYARIHNLNNGQAARQLMAEMGWERPDDTGRAPVQTSAPSPAESARDAADDAERVADPARAVRQPKWRAIVPVPPHAPKPGFVFGYKDKKRGDVWVEQEAVKTWEYRFEGELQGYVARFERTNSAGELVKDTVARTWCENLEDGRGLQRWHWKQWESPRPLYVPATLLSGDLSLPVVIVEGEKCAEAGHQLLGHEFDFVSWPGGCKAWAMARWSLIMGRSVILWPDCDAQRMPLTRAEREQGEDAESKAIKPAHKQPGMQAMVHIGTELVAKHGCTVSMCSIPAPGAVSDGWDIADAIAEGWEADQVRAFLRGATPFTPPNDEARAAAGTAVSAEKSRSRASAGSGDGDDESVAWRKFLLETDKGAVKSVRENIVLALDGWPERGVPGIAEAQGLIAFNEFSNNVVKRRATPWGTREGAWEEADELLLGEWLLRQHYLPSMSRQTLEEAVLMVATRHSFHPVRERVEGLRDKWDREKRLATWLQRCLYEPTDPVLQDPLLQKYLARVGTWFLMAMCARVMTQRKVGAKVVCGPGVKFDYMLILEGKQGWGKSTFANVLGGEYFADTGLNLGEKDSYQNIQGIWIYEWGELENMTKQEVGKVKLFASSPKDRFRATFDKRPRDYPRQVVFVGTTNESNYLTDITGNRRFWPVTVSRPPDNVWLDAHLDQLLAEAVAYVDAGERFYPTREEQRDLFDPQQRERTVESAIESQIRMYLYDEQQKVPHGGINGAFVNEVGMSDLLGRIGLTLDKQTDVVVKRAGSVMGALGWKIRRTSHEGRPRVYVRPPKDATQASAGASGVSTRQDAGAAEEEDDDLPF